MGQSQGKKVNSSSAGPASQTRTQQRKVVESSEPPPAAAIERLQAQTAFNQVESSKLYEVFMGLSDNGQQKLDRDTFRKGLGLLEKCGLKNLDDSPFVERLFTLLDVNHDGTIDLQEFVVGLSVLCKGTVEEKLELSFKAYDIDGSGTISKDELAAMFKSAWISGFRALCATHGNDDLSMDDLNEFSEEMATLFAENAFETLDTNGDGMLSFEEFKEFAMAEPKITATLNGFKKEVSITFW